MNQTHHSHMKTTIASLYESLFFVENRRRWGKGERRRFSSHCGDCPFTICSRARILFLFLWFLSTPHICHIFPCIFSSIYDPPIYTYTFTHPSHMNTRHTSHLHCHFTCSFLAFTLILCAWIRLLVLILLVSGNMFFIFFIYKFDYQLYCIHHHYPSTLPPPIHFVHIFILAYSSPLHQLLKTYGLDFHIILTNTHFVNISLPNTCLIYSRSWFRPRRRLFRFWSLLTYSGVFWVLAVFGRFCALRFFVFRFVARRAALHSWHAAVVCSLFAWGDCILRSFLSFFIRFVCAHHTFCTILFANRACVGPRIIRRMMCGVVPDVVCFFHFIFRASFLCDCAPRSTSMTWFHLCVFCMLLCSTTCENRSAKWIPKCV